MKQRRNGKRKIVVAAMSSLVRGILPILGFSLASTTRADVAWTGTNSSNFNDTGNWASNPAGQTLDINNTGNAGAYPIITSTATFSPVDLLIGTGTTGRLDQTGGLAGTGNGNWFFLGYQGGHATFNLADTTTTGGATTGYGPGTGSFNVGGGSPNGTNFFIGLDDTTTSTVNVNTTGTLSSGNIYVGGAGASNGTLNLDNGSIYCINDLRVAGSPYSNPASAAGTDLLNVSGGTISANIIAFSSGVNNGSTSVGRGYVSGGTVSARAWLTLGFCGTTTAQGILTNAGGTINVNTGNQGASMEMSTYDSAGALYTQTAGALNLEFNSNIGFGNGGNNNGTSDFEQNGGTVTFFSDGGTTPGGTGSLIIGVGNSSGTYAYNFNGGTLTVPGITKTAAGATGTFTFNGGTLKPTGSNTSFISNLTAANVAAGGAKINTNGFNVTVGQNLLTGVTGASDGGLSKSGSGILTLTGSNTYTGPTAITGGTLALTGTASINSSSLVVISGGAKFLQLSSTPGTVPVNVSGGTLDGTGSLSAVTISNSLSNTLAAGNGSIGQLTTSALTFNGAANLSLFTNAASNNSAGILTNTLTTGATAGQIKVNAATADSIWANGTYDLLAYNSSSGAGFSAFSLGTVSGLTGRQTAALTSINGSTDYVALTISGVAGNLVWTGATNSNWTTSSTAQNWTLNGSSTSFQTGDAVVFDDTASGSTTVSVSDATVAPLSVTFNNSNLAYSISGPGSISGSTGLTLSGAGMVTLNNSNTYTGGTTLNNGILNINSPAALGAGTLTINGGTIDNTSGSLITLSNNNAQVWGSNVAFGGTNALNMGTGAVTLANANTSVTVNGSAPVAIGGVISGSGASITKLGSGTIVFTGAESYSGNTIVNGGTLIVTGSGASLNSTLMIANGTGYTGTMTITNGAIVASPGEVAVTNDGGTATLNVTDGGTLNANSWLSVGRGYGATNPAQSTLNVLGGTVNTNGAHEFVTGSFGGAGNVAVTNVGYGSNGTTPGVINSASEIWVADDGGTGTMNISSGAQVNANNWLIVGRQGGVGVLNISGSGSITKSSNNPFYVGFSYSTGGATAVVNQTGGTIISAAPLGMANSGPDTATYNLSGGTLTVPQIYKGGGTATFNFNGGTLQANSGANSAFMSGLTSANVLAGGAIIDSNSQTITVSQALTTGVTSGSDGGLTKLGAGSLTISGSNTYSGPTLVKAGNLIIKPVAQPALLAGYSFDNTAATPVSTPTSISASGSGASVMGGTVIQAAGDGSSVQIVSGGPNINGNGGAGNSLQFDGNGGTVNISSGAVNLGGNSSWTVSLWVQTSQAGATMFSKNDGGWVGGNSVFYFTNGVSTSGTYPSAVRNAGGFVSGAQAVTDGNWHMVTYVDNAGTKTIYVDGVATAPSATAFNGNDVGGTIQLGYSPDTIAADGTQQLTGNLDDLNFYNAALSPTQIGSLYTTNNANLSASPNTALPAGTSLNISSGATAMVASHDAGAPTVAPQVASLQIAGATNAWTGLLDVTNNGIDIHSGSVTDVNNQLKAGYNNGAWNGSAGIVSGTAASDASHLTAVGMIVNDDGGGHPLYGVGGAIASTFNNIVPADGDILLKYTYYGDANLDGHVDGSDYTRIDNGYLSHLTGWFNGDFNYDGVVNGSDYTLIDNAFNTQGASLASQLASPTVQLGNGNAAAVPEPATLSLIAVAAFGMLGRRRSVKAG